MNMDCFIELPINSLQEHMNRLAVSQLSKTNVIFAQRSYDKGIVLLNMIATLFKLEHKSEDYTHFFQAFRELIKKFEYKTIKIFDIWSTINGATSHELFYFAHS